jgi:4-amino-4-deoxy-L-arabinose transferase-like glycosyltransferase
LGRRVRALSAVAPIELVLAGAGTAEAAEAGLQRSVEWSWGWWILTSLAVAALWYVTDITRLHRRLGQDVSLADGK